MAIEIGNNLNNLEKKQNKFIGIKMPFGKSDGAEGYFSSHTLTSDSIKEDLILLLNTNRGERLMQPTMGINLNEFLFENMTEDSINIIKSELIDMLGIWMPFIKIHNLEILTDDSLDSNKLLLNIQFIIQSSPGKLESIQINVQDGGY